MGECAHVCLKLSGEWVPPGVEAPLCPTPRNKLFLFINSVNPQIKPLSHDPCGKGSSEKRSDVDKATQQVGAELQLASSPVNLGLHPPHPLSSSWSPSPLSPHTNTPVHRACSEDLGLQGWTRLGIV